MADRAEELVPVFLDAFGRAAERLGVNPKLHVVTDQLALIPESWRSDVEIVRAEGPVTEAQTETIGWEGLGVEWEWEKSPEVTLVVVESVDQAVDLFNTQSPRFAASLISVDQAQHDRFFSRVDAPFVGNGFTRWVDGQFALNRPELGLSNWEFGRLFARGGVLSGDSVYTVRSRVTQSDPAVGRWS